MRLMAQHQIPVIARNASDEAISPLALPRMPAP